MGTEYEKRYLLTQEQFAQATRTATQTLEVEQHYPDCMERPLPLTLGEGKKVTAVTFEGVTIPIPPEKQEEFFGLTKDSSYHNGILSLGNDKGVRFRKVVVDKATGAAEYFFTIKLKSFNINARPEFEVPCSQAVYERTKKFDGAKSLTKTRYIVPLEGGLKAEIDRFTANGRKVDLTALPPLAEIEYAPGQAIVLPPFISPGSELIGKAANNHFLAGLVAKDVQRTAEDFQRAVKSRASGRTTP